jgi:hypothetical protein
VGSREPDRPSDIVWARAPDDERRMAIDHAVVDGPCLVIARIGGADELIAEIGEIAARELGQRGCCGH